MPTLYWDPMSGNCRKVTYVADHLGIPLARRGVELMAGETRSADFLALSPAGQVPILVLDDGRVLSESNAIMLYLARGSALVPEDPFEEARMLQWLFWEQYSHEPYVAVRRFRLRYLREPEAALDPRLAERGHKALAVMEGELAGGGFLVGTRPSLADVALVAYTRLAGEGGFDLAAYPALRAWIARVEAALGIAD